MVLHAGVAAGMGVSLALVFVLTIGVAFIDAAVAMYAWLLLVPICLFRRFREHALREDG